MEFKFMAILTLTLVWLNSIDISRAEGKYLETRDKVKIYYETAGNGAEAIVVSGGFLVSDLLKPLAENHRVVFYDARGRGRSDAVPAEKVSIDHQIQDLEDLRIKLNLNKMILLGWSGMGKEFALYTIRYPERVSKLVQVSPVPPRAADYMEKMMSGREKKMDAAKLAELRKKREEGVWANDPEGYCRAENDVVNPANFADPADAKKQPDTCVYSNEWAENLGPYFQALIPSVEQVELIPMLKKLKVPRLVIHGVEDSIPVEGAREWVAGMPNSCLMLIQNAAHWPFAEQPEIFFPAVESFLNGKWPEAATSCSGHP